MNKTGTPDAIKAARQKAGLTQKEVEEALDLRQLMIKDVETGRLKLSTDLAMKLSKLYRISLEELVGQRPKIEQNKSRKYSSLISLFQTSNYKDMMNDSVIRGHLELYREDIFTLSLFDLIAIELSEVRRIQFIYDLIKTLCSLAGADKKVLDEEIDFLEEILNQFELCKMKKELGAFFTNQDVIAWPDYVQKSLVLKHFIIWLMFYLATVDKKIAREELTYIEEVAEKLRMPRSNFLNIRSKFKEEGKK